MANLLVDQSGTSTYGLPVKVVRVFHLQDDLSAIRIRTGVSTGQIWPRGNYVAGQGWL